MPRPALLFSVLAVGLGWASAVPGLVAGGAPGGVGFLPLLTPLLSAGLVSLLAPPPGGLTRALGLRLRLSRWLLLSLAFPVLAVLLTTAVALALPGVAWDPTGTGLLERMAPTLSPEDLLRLRAEMAGREGLPLLLGALAQGLVAGATVNALLALWEEVGWRGFLYRHIAPRGFWRTAGLTGLVWGLWQMPLALQGVNYPQHPVAGAGLVVGLALLLSPWLTLVRARTGSVVGPALMRGVLAGLGGLPLLALQGGSDLSVGLTGASGLVALALLTAGLTAYNRLRGGDLLTLPPEDGDALDQRGDRPGL